MADAPNDRKYLQSHEWHKVEADQVRIGITQFAADELTDITYVKLPAVGDKVEANRPFGEIESVKATSDLVCGVTGTVTEVNEKLAADPGLVNRDPYNEGWMLKVKVASTAEVNGLLAVEDYLKVVGH